VTLTKRPSCRKTNAIDNLPALDAVVLRRSRRPSERLRNPAYELSGGLAVNQSHVSLFPGTLPVDALARQLERREGDEYWATPSPLSSTLAFKRERSYVASSHGLDKITLRYGALIGILNFGWYFCRSKSFEIRIPNKRRLWIEAPQALILPISFQTRRFRFLLERI
jgi:hypothetical protein